MSYITISCLCLALLVGAHANGEKHRMRGGDDANIADYPYQVSMRKNGAHDCGGSIISKRHILTAAHCIHDGKEITISLDKLTIRTGSTLSTGDGGRIYNVERIAAHEGWTNGNSYINDIAVITLTEDIEFDALTKTIDLPTEDLATKGKAAAVTTGWGINGEHATAAMVVLQKANMTILSTEVCQKRMGSMELYPGHVCAYQKKGVGTCTGDSGGPLATGNVLVGVTSWGMYPCGGGAPDVFANVYYYKDWILKKMEE